MNSPTYRPQVGVTFQEFVEKWKASVLQSYKPSTQAHLLSDINNHLLPLIGDVMLSHITTEVLQGFVASRKASPKTVANLIGVMRSLWKVAKAWGYINHSPFEGLMLARVPKPEPKMFTVDEVRRIIEAAPEPHKTFYWLAAETGMRAGELCGLCWEDINYAAHVVFVRQSAWKKYLSAPKTEAGRRRFCISTALAEHLHSRRQGASGLVFASKHGSPWRGGKVVERNLAPLLRELRIAHRGLHAFRHLNGSLMDLFGTPIKVRQQRLGHSTAAITLDRYTHLVSEDDRNVAERIGGILHPLVPKSEAMQAST